MKTKWVCDADCPDIEYGQCCHPDNCQKKEVMKLCECPICGGSGKFELPNQMEVDTIEVKGRIAKELRSKGYSIRQIMRGLGYKSPRSVTYILAKNGGSAKVL